MFLTAQPQRIDPPPDIRGISINILPTAEADGILAYERAGGRVEVPVAVIAQPGLFIKVLTLHSKRLGHLCDRQRYHAAQGVVGGRPDDVAVGPGQLAGQAVDVVVIIIDPAVAVNKGQRFEGAGVIDIFAGRLVLEAFGQKGVTVPGKEGAFAFNGLDAPAAQGIIAEADGAVVGGADAALKSISSYKKTVSVF